MYQMECILKWCTINFPEGKLKKKVLLSPQCITPLQQCVSREPTGGRTGCGCHGTRSGRAPNTEVGSGGGGLGFLLSWIPRSLCEHYGLHREWHLWRWNRSRTVGWPLHVWSLDTGWGLLVRHNDAVEYKWLWGTTRLLTISMLRNSWLRFDWVVNICDV